LTDVPAIPDNVPAAWVEPRDHRATQRKGQDGVQLASYTFRVDPSVLAAVQEYAESRVDPDIRFTSDFMRTALDNELARRSSDVKNRKMLWRYRMDRAARERSYRIGFLKDVRTNITTACEEGDKSWLQEILRGLYQAKHDFEGAPSEFFADLAVLLDRAQRSMKNL